MYPFNTVFVQLVNDEPGMIFGDDLIAIFRDAIQVFDDQTTEGIIVLRGEVCMQMIIDVIQAHGSLNNIFAVRNFLDKFVFVFVVLIVDLTDNFLKNVFQSDKTGHFTVLIENNGDIEGGFSHFYQKIGDIFVFIGEMRLAKKVADIKGIILIVKKKILHIVESVKPDKEDDEVKEMDAPLDLKEMFVLAVATSIDALAVGITFAFLDYPIVEAITVIGITTFVISIGGVYVGNFFGNKYEKKAEFVGGLILVLLGVRILLTHLGIL